MPLRNLSIVLFSLLLGFACYLKADLNRQASVISLAMQKVKILYLEKVDERQLFEDAMSGMMQGLDPYSAYIGPESFRRIEEDLDQEFGGVGIEIEKDDPAAPLLVLSPVLDSPAYREGLHAGDQILEIDGVSTIGMTRQETVSRMRGKPGTEVRLQVRHAGEEETFNVVIRREVIVIHSVLGESRREDGGWDHHLESDPRIGYVRITHFGNHTADELRTVLMASENRDFAALLLDLRGNAGGLLSAAVETCDLFLEDGRIVSTRGRDGNIRRSYDAKANTIVPSRMPIVILVNKYSASASEIVAACLQDYGRAAVVGERTWGKGTVQNLVELEGGRSALRLTTASYWRPSGQDIHKNDGEDEDDMWGVRPNQGLEVVLTLDEMKAVVLQRRKKDHLVDSHAAGEPENALPRDRQREAAEAYLKSRLGELKGEAHAAVLRP